MFSYPAYSYEINFTIDFQRPGTLIEYQPEQWSCLQDGGVFGLFFAGSAFISMASRGSEISIVQGDQGNMVLILATQSTCRNVRQNIEKVRSLVPEPFISFIPLVPLANVILDFPEINVMGDLSKRGVFSIILEKTESGISIDTK